MQDVFRTIVGNLGFFILFFLFFFFCYKQPFSICHVIIELSFVFYESYHFFLPLISIIPSLFWRLPTKSCSKRDKNGWTFSRFLPFCPSSHYHLPTYFVVLTVIFCVWVAFIFPPEIVFRERDSSHIRKVTSL